MNGLYRIKTIDGTKQLQAFQGTELPSFPSVPVGAIIPMYTTAVPTGYLPCNGAEYDTEQFPLLYIVLGTNVLPDLRECVLVGAGTNETDNIASHDVYTINEFKDDQVQSHTHSSLAYVTNFVQGGNGPIGTVVGGSTGAANGRTGTTTHGKQKGVFYIIKATSNIEDAESNSEITEALRKFKKDLVDTIESTEAEWVANKIEEYYDETVLFEAASTATNIAANTVLNDSILNYRTIRFYLRRSASLSSEPIPFYEIDQTLIENLMMTSAGTYNLMLPGYGSEYRQLKFNASGTTVTAVAGAECLWKIVGIGRI